MRYGPGVRSGPAPSAARSKQVAQQLAHPVKNHIMNTQRFLQSKGYHIAVDGVMGKQTRAAIADWHTGPKNRPMLAKHHEATTTVLAGKNPPRPHAGRTGGGGGGGARGGGGGKAPAAPATQLINPQQYARAAVNEAYGPVIADLLHQQGQVTAQGAQNQADISSWFKQLEGTRASGAKNDAAALAQAVTQNQQDVSGIEGLFGQSGGHDLAAVAANNLANLRATGQATSDFNSHMAAVLAAQGVDAHLAQQRSTDATLSDLASKLTAQRGARGAAYNKALQDAYGTRLQQQAAIQNMQLAQQMAPVQLASAKAALAGTKAKTKIALKQLELQGKQAAMQDKITQAQLKQFKQTNSGQAVPFHTLQAGDRLKLSATITKGIRSNLHLGKNGTGMASSAQGNHRVWGAIKAMLSPYDTSDPEVRKFAIGILHQLSSGFQGKNFK